MNLSMVVVVEAVDCNGSAVQTLMEKGGALNLRFEKGLVWFDDKTGEHFVPLSNVRRATVAKAKSETEPK